MLGEEHFLNLYLDKRSRFFFGIKPSILLSCGAPPHWIRPILAKYFFSAKISFDANISNIVAPLCCSKLQNTKNNSKRPVDALAEKHISPTDNLKSRDASASKKSGPGVLVSQLWLQKVCNNNNMQMIQGDPH